MNTHPGRRGVRAALSRIATMILCLVCSEAARAATLQLLSPICPGAPFAVVSNATAGATLNVLMNGDPGYVVGTAVGLSGQTPIPLTSSTPPKGDGTDYVVVQQTSASGTQLSNQATLSCPGNLITYHNDPSRTGWSRGETILTPANVNAASFGLLETVTLDDPNDQVDAQPLVVSKLAINGATHNVVYLVTAANNVYALDADSGARLLKTNLGAPVPYPLGCGNNAPVVGITSTPAIDLVTGRIFIMSYSLSGATPIYQLHALQLTTLQEAAGSPVTVAAAQTLQNGQAYGFYAAVQRQRPALLLANGLVYAGFGSFCDFGGWVSRGWVMGWYTSALTLPPQNLLLNLESASNTGVGCFKAPCYFNSVWMSGFGLAATEAGSVMFTTGNTAAGTYSVTLDPAESLIIANSSLTSASHYTGIAQTEYTMDEYDLDFSSGGALAVPNPNIETGPLLWAAAGKIGFLYLGRRDDLSATPTAFYIGPCWCGPSYFKDSSGVNHIISSGGNTVILWRLVTGPAISQPYLVAEASAAVEASTQDGGFFTSISSNANVTNTAIVWAVSRTSGLDNHVTLYAFDPSNNLALLWSQLAGYWPNVGGNSNLVPSIVNGKVYVASNRQLSIFGLTGGNNSAQSLADPVTPRSSQTISGEIVGIQGQMLTVAPLGQTQTVQVDVSGLPPEASSHAGVVGRSFAFTGKLRNDGVLVAAAISRVKAGAVGSNAE